MSTQTESSMLRTTPLSSLLRRGVVGASLLALSACGGSQAPAPEPATSERTELRTSDSASSGTGLTANTTAFTVDGIPVILKQTPGNPMVASQLIVRGGVRDDTATNAGLEQLMFSTMSMGGPSTMSKTEFFQALASMGSGASAGVNYDYATIACASVLPVLDETWELCGQMITQPAFRESDLELEREQHLQSLRSLTESPDDAVAEMLRDAVFAGHPYERRPIGTADVISGATVADLRDMHATVMTKDRLLFVVVGDVTPERVRDYVRHTFGDLPDSNAELAVPELVGPQLSITPVAPLTEARDGLPTSYVLGYYALPSPSDPEFAAVVAGVEIYSDRLFEEVRTRRNLTYAVSAGTGRRGTNTGFLYVTAADPHTTVQVMLDTLEGMTTADGIAPSDLEDQIEMYLTQYWIGLQMNGAQAGMLARWELLGGGWEDADRFVEQLEALTPETVASAMDRYLRDMQFAIVGDSARLALPATP
ncbi:MAG: zinc protease [Flavobacteriales bacterium]|jgi:zinc protease